VGVAAAQRSRKAGGTELASASRIMSASTRADVIDLIRRLLVSCSDGVEGYRHAAEDVTSKTLRRFLAHGAAEREEVACVLTNLLVTLGHKPTHHGSLEGAIHRRWMDAVGAVKPHPDGAILHECQRGEQEMLALFAGALEHDLPNEVRSVIQAQLDRIFRASAALNAAVDVDRNQSAAE
jgi:uncharacterized protein (TIGR02284 family)